MLRIAFHIGLRCLVWFVMALTLVAGLFVVTQLLRVAPLLAGAGVGLLELLHFSLETAIPVTAWAATPAFVAAVVITFAQMDADGESVALEAVGLGRLARTGGPLVLVLPVAVFVAGAALWAGPQAARSARLEAVDFASRALEQRIRPGRVTELAEGVSIYVESRKDGLLSGLWIDDRRSVAGLQLAAKEARLGMRGGRLELFMERGTVIMPAADGGNPAAVAFETLTSSFDLRAVLDEQLSFLPEELTASTARLLGPPPKGVSAAEWGFALWRRVGQVVGFVVLCFFALDLSTRPFFSRRALNIAVVAAAFTAFHLVGRAAETALAAGGLGAEAAALLPSAVIAAGSSLRVMLVVVKRLSMR